jgi:hypothetical protein
LLPGLRLIAIDASKYEEYGPSGDVAAGRIKPATLSWILTQMAVAKQQHVQVFAMMHHNLIEHYTGQSQLDPGYVIDNYEQVANMKGCYLPVASCSNLIIKTFYHETKLMGSCITCSSSVAILH